MPISPTSHQRQKLRDALVSAFPERSSLLQLLYYELDKNLNQITKDSNLKDTVFELIRTAESEGWLIDLITAARKENPGNSQLEVIALELLSPETSFTLSPSSSNSVTVVLPKQEQEIEGSADITAGYDVFLAHNSADKLSVRDISEKTSNPVICYGSNNQIQFVVPSTKNLQQQPPERQIPPLLPYLVNRSQQEYELEKGIKKLIKKAPLSPLICIIHGDEFQSHDKFLERLHKVSLPKCLGQDSIKQYHLPSPPKLKNVHEFSDYLRTTLANIVIKRSSASLEEINTYFNECSIPILIHTHLLTEQLQKKEFATLDSLLNFWHTWPAQSNKNLIICIFIKYQIRRKKHTNNFDLISLFFSFVSYFLKLDRYQRVNQKIYQYIETLSLSNFDKFNRLSGLVLPELTGVNRGEVEDWVRMEYTQNVIGEVMADKLIKEIRELFHKWEEQNSSNTIPMDDLADNLIKLMKSNLLGEGEMT